MLNETCLVLSLTNASDFGPCRRYVHTVFTNAKPSSYIGLTIHQLYNTYQSYQCKAKVHAQFCNKR